jgi:hypothetical protein
MGQSRSAFRRLLDLYRALPFAMCRQAPHCKARHCQSLLCVSKKERQTDRLRRCTTKTAKEAKSQHLVLRSRETTCRVENEVNKISVLQHRHSSKDLGERCQNEGSLSVTKKKNCHDQLPHEALWYSEVTCDSRQCGCDHRRRKGRYKCE